MIASSSPHENLVVFTLSKMATRSGMPAVSSRVLIAAMSSLGDTSMCPPHK